MIDDGYQPLVMMDSDGRFLEIKASTRECIKNPPILFSFKCITLQRFQKNINFPSRLSLSVRNQALEKGELAVLTQKDAVIIVDHGSRRQESNYMLNDFVSMFKSRTGYQIVLPAHMELAEPTIKDAFKLCVQLGATRVIVSPFFLFPGRHWHQDIPKLVAEAAGEHSGISYIITAPLGLHELMVDVMNDRIKHCLSHVTGDAEECSTCAGTGRCQLY
ncbi:hypothetical protein HPP92_027364 [Vanilla planifolia]|uniref:Sirohydrochlorin ferrochelatase n=1 Tax=Vanilla planifolia TaxID=51239 RepID=A0A835PF45_VANPL|nr:hypothetical protein HPP92_027364 [Vanilla planifolia]